jgi:creatinine amidohydrolase
MKLTDMKWPEVEALSRDTPVVFPIAAQEQHGHHMPLHTDSILLAEIVSRVEVELADEVLFAPLQWLGNSHHHMDFPGTISAEPRLYIDLLINEIECFLAHGFKRLVLLNGHGGNIVPGAQAVFELRQKYRDRSDLLLLSTTYWENGQPHEKRSDFVQSAMGHAGEWETSMMLTLRPELVGDYASALEQPQGSAFSTATRGWTMKDRTVQGHIGTPSAASREKGETLLDCFSSGVKTFLNEVCRWDGKSWEC